MAHHQHKSMMRRAKERERKRKSDDKRAERLARRQAKRGLAATEGMSCNERPVDPNP
jgi:hypothetical protein